MGGTSEKTTSSRSDTMKGLFTAINKARTTTFNAVLPQVCQKKLLQNSTVFCSNQNVVVPQRSAVKFNVKTGLN